MTDKGAWVCQLYQKVIQYGVKSPYLCAYTSYLLLDAYYREYPTLEVENWNSYAIQ